MAAVTHWLGGQLNHQFTATVIPLLCPMIPEHTHGSSIHL